MHDDHGRQRPCPTRWQRQFTGDAAGLATARQQLADAAWFTHGDVNALARAGASGEARERQAQQPYPADQTHAALTAMPAMLGYELINGIPKVGEG